ncbi:hypothetical protein [Sorangium sp. So ce341]|uniref:hypothetical protein n=1 Tax=Sorangium sp. So ce341 TaxID=3133302 RepID=UPI003F5DF83B
MNELPPRARLARVLRALASELPAQMDQLTGAPRFADGFEALARFSEGSHAEAAADRMTPEEAGALADRLLAAWRRIGAPKLPPAAAIRAPREVWVGPSARQIEVHAEVAGVEPAWEAVWEPPALPGPPARSATVVVAPPEGPCTLTLVAHVRARAEGGERVVLLAEARVAVRAPVAAATADPRVLRVIDHTGAPAASVRVEADDQTADTDDEGLAHFSSAVHEGAAIRVEGAGARRLSRERA